MILDNNMKLAFTKPMSPQHKAGLKRSINALKRRIDSPEFYSLSQNTKKELLDRLDFLTTQYCSIT